MLAEKFFLVLETIRSNAAHNDGAPRVQSTARHVPIALPATDKV